MPDPATLSDLPLADAERVAARRHLGYPVYGNEAGANQGWRYFQWYGQLEFRLANLTPIELQEIRRQLAILERLDAAVLDAADNLDTDQAAVWIRNKREVKDRKDLLNTRRRDLAAFLGIPMGPGASGSEGSCRVIV